MLLLPEYIQVGGLIAEILIRIDRGIYAVSGELEGLSLKVEDIFEMTIKHNDETRNIKINGGKNQ